MIKFNCDPFKKKVKKSSFKKVNEIKLGQNITRAKSNIFEIAICNDFKYFVTLTIDKAKYDRFDFKTYYNDFSVFIQNQNRDNDREIKYLLIPELHKDGAYHMHGLIKGFAPGDLIINTNSYIDWPKYKERFGYISLSKVRDQKRIASYITKYLYKTSVQFIEKLGMHLYYCSKNLNRSEDYKYGSGKYYGDYDFTNEYIAIKSVNRVENLNIIFNIEELRK